MSEERARVLRLLEEGKINAEQAARLIEALRPRREEVNDFTELPRPPRPPRPPLPPRVAMAELDRIPDIVAGAVASAMKSGFGTAAELKSAFPGKSSLFLKSVSGDVQVTGWDEDRIEVESTGGFAKVRERDDKVMIRSISGDYTIRTPREARLELVSVSGDVEVSGVGGRFVLKSVSGDVDLVGFKGEVEASVVSGDLSLDGFSGKVLVESKSGDITCRPAGPLEGSMVSKSGDIELQLAADADLVLDMECEEEGEIVVGLSFPFETLEEEEHRLKLELGDGNRELVLRTRDGEIRLADAEEE